MAQHAILRFEKHKGNPARPLEAHHERQKEQYASNPDIDTSRSKYNFHIVKPEGTAEPEERDSKLCNGGIEYDDKSKTVTVDGEPVSLTPTEMQLLKFFLENLDCVFSPQEIYRKVWNDTPFGSENTVTVHIRHLREKIEINPARPDYLKVSWGHGYKMEKK